MHHIDLRHLPGGYLASKETALARLNHESLRP